MSLTIKWFPRSWLQICYQETVLYIDPSYMKTYFQCSPTKIEFAVGPGEDDGLPEELPTGHIILITHAHKDHCKNTTVNRLCNENTVICGPKNCTGKLDRPLRMVQPGDSFDLLGIRIDVIAAYNTPSGNSIRKVHKKGVGVGYLITLGDISIYHAGDTDLIPEMTALKNIDIAFLPVGGTFTMNIVEAVQAANAIAPKWVVPIHHLNSDPASFIALVSGELPQINGKHLSMGETWMIG